jgi:hypothetical protein
MERIYGYEFSMFAYWAARPETPDEIAIRFLRYIDLLAEIDPLLSRWISGAKGPRKLESIRDRYAKEIAARVSTDDFGVACPDEGYWFGAYTRDCPDPLSFAVRVHAGSHLKITRHQNDALFTNCSGIIPAPYAIIYRIFKQALLAAVEAWEPVDAVARPYQLLEGRGRHDHFYAAWVQYLNPSLTSLIVPPPPAIVEHLPNGGILMSATDETFNPDNPAHLTVARDIAAATAPLNTLPYVRDPKFPWI